MTRIRKTPVVAGVDDSAVGMEAARWAARDAEMRGTSLMLVAVDTVTVAGGGVGGPISQSVYDSIRADNERVLQEAVDEVLGLVPGLAVDTQIRIGDSAAELIEVSPGAQLIVVGTRGHGEFTGLLVGSVARALVGHARSPVLVVGRHEVDSPKVRDGSVVIGVDGSATSDRALREGFAEATGRRTAITAVHSPNDRGDVAKTADDETDRRTETKEFLAEHLRPWQDLYPEVPVRYVVGEESPARSLARHGVEAQMIVVGSRGRGGFTGLLLGSVSRGLLHMASCPLMVAR